MNELLTLDLKLNIGLYQRVYRTRALSTIGGSGVWSKVSDIYRSHESLELQGRFFQ